MGRLLLLVMILVVLVTVLWLVYWGFNHLLQRRRQKELARFAPELLQYHGVPPEIGRLVVEQRKQLRSAAEIIDQTINDQAVLIPSEYAEPMEEWLRDYRTNQRREIQ